MKWLCMLAIVVGCSGRPWGRRYTGGPVDPAKQELELAERALKPGERAKLDRNDFVILVDAAGQSFHVGYTALFHAHKPVYITADSLLYAWHSSYDKILIEIEQAALIPALDTMLEDLRTRLANSATDAQTRADLDVYLAVGLGLLRGKPQHPVAGGDPAQIAKLVQQGEAAEGGDLVLFGSPMELDFTMLKPRGHYTTLPALQQYFRAMSWLGRAEIRIAKRESPHAEWNVNRRALNATLLLAALFDEVPRAKWETIDSTITAFVGPQDSLSLPGLRTALASIADPAHVSDAQLIDALHGPAIQRIHTQLEHAGSDSVAFLLLGQRYVFDANVLGDLVYGKLATDPPRLMPTPLDVAHAVFHNPAAKPLLAQDLARYGEPYAKALAELAARPIPEDSVAHLWLGALRELSPDAARDAALPAPLQSDAWSRRMMGTQLASWAELRHDNLLYTKQSFTAELGCEFPDAYVDPYPAFYARMEQIADRMRKTIAKALPNKAERALHYLDGMGKTMAHLRAIAERERANQPLTGEDLEFVNHMVSLDGRDAVCTVEVDPNGWYAELYYEQKTALWHDPVIADVHTQPTDEAGNNVGHVLHVATGKPVLAEFRLKHDGGAHTQTYRGFVSSYAELVTDNFQRLTDEEWKQRIEKRMVPPPSWLAEIQGR
jgi:hypothetical protein